MRPSEENIPQAAGFVPPPVDTARPIAVVDDSLDDMEFLRHEIAFLFGEAHVVTFHGGNALIGYLHSHPLARDLPRLILLDLAMNGQDGLRTLEFLRRDAKYADIPVIVVSGTEDPAQVRRALTAGAQAFLPKPVSRRDFIDIFHRRASTAAEPPTAHHQGR